MDEGQTLGPSAYAGTERPYLSRVYNLGSQEILQLGLGESLAAVDAFILDIVTERKWEDTDASYQSVLSEIRENLGIHPNLQPLLALERLSRGVQLLRLQKMHRRRDAEIQRAIQKLNS